MFANGVWTPTAAPGPANSSNVTIHSVSCGAVGSCVAVGTYHDTATNEGASLVDTYAGGIWTAAEAPAVHVIGTATNNYELDSVSCAAAGSCAAVGLVGGGGGTNCDFSRCGGAEVALTLTSERWVPVVSRVDDANIRGIGGPNQDPGLNSVSCWAPGSCAAVGGFGGFASSAAYVASSKGGTWKNAQISLPLGSVSLNDGLGYVSCGAANFCVGLGSYLTRGTPSHTRAVLAIFNGSSWSETTPTLPAPLNEPNKTLYMGGVSCSGTGSGSCAGVGTLESAVPMAVTN